MPTLQVQCLTERLPLFSGQVLSPASHGDRFRPRYPRAEVASSFHVVRYFAGAILVVGISFSNILVPPTGFEPVFPP